MQSWRVARITLLEALRKKDFYVLVILLGFYALVAWALLRERDKVEPMQRMLLSLGLTFSFASSAILVAVLAARQVPKEIENRTILPLLAKPLSRWEFLAGKVLACWTVGVIALLCFVVLIRVIVPAPAGQNNTLFAQTIALKIASLGALSAVTVMLSLFLPESLNIALSLGYYFFWGFVFTAIASGLAVLGGPGRAVTRLLYILPHFEVLNVSRVYLADVAPISGLLVLGLLAYAGAYALIALLVAYNLFERRWV
jgi:ABC-type transport system involved in multi-copper enzyme maturation permease subunit